VWSSAQAHLSDKTDKLLTDPGWLVTDNDRREYAQFVAEGGQEGEVRRATSTGRPLGGIEFYSRLEHGDATRIYS
jgi:hypothetical protein